MRKLSVKIAHGFWPVAYSLLFVFVSQAQAAPCYGTRMPAKNKFFAGLQNYTLFNRYLENEAGEMRSTQYFFQLSYGVSDWISVDLKSGLGNIKQNPQTRAELDYPSNFAGGYGFRVRLLDQEKIKAVVGFQHISVHPRSIQLGEDKHQAVLDDWQVSLLASYDLNSLVPYIGTRLSRVDYIHWNVGDRKRIMSDLTKCVGLIVGADLSLNDRTWLNIEGQLIDSEALAVSLNFAF